MTIVDDIIKEVTFKHIKDLLAKNVDDKFIAEFIKMPIKKVRDLINKINPLTPICDWGGLVLRLCCSYQTI